MKRFLIASSSILVGVLSTQAFATQTCQHPFTKVLPYDLPLGGDKASILLHADVRFNYDCVSAQAESNAAANVSFMNLDLNVLNAKAVAVSNLNSGVTPGSVGSASVTILGYEVVNEGLDFESLVDMDPSQDIDVSETYTFNIGPVPVPVNYGIEGTAGIHINGGVQSIGIGFQANPHIDTHAYVQAGGSLGDASAEIRGDLVVLQDKLVNLLHLGIYDGADTSEVRFSATSNNNFLALQGGALVRANLAGQSFEKTLFDWQGVSREDLLFDYSDQLVVLQ